MVKYKTSISSTIIRHYVSLKFKTKEKAKAKAISVSFRTCISESSIVRLYSTNSLFIF